MHQQDLAEIAVMLEIIGDMIEERASIETSRSAWLHDIADTVHERSTLLRNSIAEIDRVGAETYSRSDWTTTLRSALWPLKSS